MDIDQSESSQHSDDDNLFGPSTTVSPFPAPPPESDPQPADARAPAQAKFESTIMQIKALHHTDAKLASLLDIASKAVASLHPAFGPSSDQADSLWNQQSSREDIKKHTDAYYALLNASSREPEEHTQADVVGPAIGCSNRFANDHTRTATS